MNNTLNVPYVKKYDENGKLLNPIKGIYLSGVSNRRKSKKFRFMNNSKSIPLVVNQKSKYFKRLQEIVFVNKLGKLERRFIEHYVLK
jgi:hypothetical protein